MKNKKLLIPFLLTTALASFAAAALTAHVVLAPLVRKVNALESLVMRTVSGEILRIASDSFRNLRSSGTTRDAAGEEVFRWEALVRIHRYRAIDGISVHHAAVVDGQGRVLADSARLLEGSDIPSLPGLPVEGDLSFRDREGNTILAHHRYFPPWGWHVLAMAREQDLVGETNRIRTRLVGTAVALLLVLLSLAYLMFRILVRKPLRELARAMNGFPGGQDLPLPASGWGVTEDLAGAYNRMTAIIRQRQAELAERAELAEATPNLVMKVARDGRILYANRSVEQMLHLLGLPPQHHELLLPDDLEAIVEEVFAGGQRNRCVLLKIRERIVDYCVTTLGPEEAVLFHGVDVTDRLGREEQFPYFRTMETWRQIVSVAANDLQSLLTGILRNVAALKNGGIADPGAADSITGIENAAMGGLPLTRRLLGFPRNGSAVFRRVDMNRMVQESIGIIRQTLPRNIEIRLEKEEELPFVSGDRTRLQQCLMNLCAIVGETMTGGGNLSVSTKTLRIDPDQPDKVFSIPEGLYVLVAIEERNRGGAVPEPSPEYVPPFPSGRESRGSGLAMRMVLGIVEDHEGFISARSLPGEGSGFHMVLPAEGTSLAGRSRTVAREDAEQADRTSC